jgi:hypothetical protein
MSDELEVIECRFSDLDENNLILAMGGPGKSVGMQYMLRNTGGEEVPATIVQINLREGIMKLQPDWSTEPIELEPLNGAFVPNHLLTPRAWKTPRGEVVVEGIIVPGEDDSLPVAHLPGGYRPAKDTPWIHEQFKSWMVSAKGEVFIKVRGISKEG